MSNRAPKPRRMTPAEANAANIRTVDRLVAEGYKPAPATKTGAPKPKPGGAR